MKIKRAGIYVRVSTDKNQDTRMQETELKQSVEHRQWNFKIYRDQGQSGAKLHRPALDELLTDIRKGQIDVVVVWSLDRLARSLRQLLELAEEFQSLGVDLWSHKQAIDTASPSGRLTYSVLASVAEFERELLRERVRSGLNQARRDGKRLGRPPLRRFDSDEISQIRTLGKKGVSVRQLAIRFETTQYIVAKILTPRQGAEKHSIFGAEK